jgi:hypothetical protein
MDYRLPYCKRKGQEITIRREELISFYSGPQQAPILRRM